MLFRSGEDGIIDYLLYSLNIKVPKFVEIGVGDYRESNTRYIFQKNCSKGLIIDKNKNLEKKVSKIVKLWKGDLTIIETAVTSKNILHILNSNEFDNNLDVFSLDVDGIDYWILESCKFVNQVLPMDDSDDTASDIIERVVHLYEQQSRINEDNTGYNIYFANGGDRKKGNVPEMDVCKDLGVVMLWGIGGGKIQSSSWLINGEKDE